MTRRPDPKHDGYRYQDLVTAYMLAKLLLERTGSITVDLKSYPHDKFDDLISSNVKVPSRRIQIKWTADSNEVFDLKILGTASRDLRIDNLLNCLPHAGASEELWVAGTFLPPDESALTASPWLQKIDASELFGTASAGCYTLNPEVIWPEYSQPMLKPLATEGCERKAFIEFCQCFRLELGTPRMSGDLRNPGQLENLIIKLLENVGVGRHPNTGRVVYDVAAVLVGFATQLRAAGEPVHWQDVASALNLQTDFGRIEQSFPFSRSRYVLPRAAAREILSSVELNKVTLVTAPPGQGKSWLLTDVAALLGRKGWAVARHYCYLQPTDSDLEYRITRDALYSNLIAEIHDAAPELLRGKTAADADALAGLLLDWGKEYPSQNLVLIIDGLDNALRAQQTLPNIAPSDVQLADEIARLIAALPNNVRIVLGSQPGLHLDAFKHLPVEVVQSVSIEPWPDQSIRALIQKHGLQVSTTDLDAVVGRIVQLAQGNPLYAFFLTRSVEVALRTHSTRNGLDVLADHPPLDGDIGRYYEYLYAGLPGNDSRRVADLLGALDFSVTDTELREIFPSERQSYVRQAITGLAPILDYVGLQGGFRIYHESYRRFVQNKVNQDEPEALRDSLVKAADWLEHNQGFRSEARAFRYLIPLLRRLGENSKVLHLVGRSYLRDSVAEGHPEIAIRANLKHAADVAADVQDWAALVRLAEIQKAMYTCFDERLAHGYIEDLGRAYAATSGGDKLASRLSFDSRAAFDWEPGIRLCAVSSEFKGVPPWDLYLRNLDSVKLQLHKNQGFELEATEKLAANILLGQLQTVGLRILDDARWLFHIDAPTVGYVRKAAVQVRQQFGETGLRHFATKVQGPELALILLELAEHLAAQGNKDEANLIAQRALSAFSHISIAARAVPLLLDPKNAQSSLPSDWGNSPMSMIGQHGMLDRAQFSLFYFSTRVAAFCDKSALQEMRKELSGGGKFRALLRSIIDIWAADATHAMSPEEAAKLIIAALQSLAASFRRSDSAAGEPRLFDLHSDAETLVRRAFERAWVLISQTVYWNEGIRLLEEIADNSRWVSNFGTYGALLGRMELVALLQKYAHTVEQYTAIAEISDRQIRDVEREHIIYDAVIESSLASALAWGKAQTTQKALKRLRRASLYLCSYGYRKDLALWDVMEPLDVLGSCDPSVANNCIRRVQPLTDVVTVRTDGKETRHAPNAWFEKLLAADSLRAVAVLADSLRIEANQFDWRLEKAYATAVAHLRSRIDPLIALHLDLAHPVPDDRDSFREQLDVVAELCRRDRNKGEDYFQVFAAHLQDEREDSPYREIHLHLEELGKFADANGLRFPRNSEPRRDTNTPTEESAISGDLPNEGRVYAEPSSIDEAVSVLYSIPPYLGLDEIDGFDVGGFFGSRIPQWLSNGFVAEAERVIHALASRARGQRAAAAILHIAKQLKDHGHDIYATELLVRAYSGARENGWRALGGTQLEPLVSKAWSINKKLAAELLAKQIAALIKAEDGYTTCGVGQNLCSLFVSLRECNIALSCWLESYYAMKWRLSPTMAPGEGAFVTYDPKSTAPSSIDEAAVILLCARCVTRHLRMREHAIIGFGEIVRENPVLAARAIRWLVQKDTTFVALTLILNVASANESAPFSLTAELKQELITISKIPSSYTLSHRASLMLERASLGN